MVRSSGPPGPDRFGDGLKEGRTEAFAVDALTGRLHKTDDDDDDD
jgi:hypothetical protein